MNVHDPEALIQCPYEKVHMIRRKRMPYHLQKCRRNYAGQAYKVCPFNARHEVPEPEYHHHLVHCPNKSMLEKDMIHIKRLQEDKAYREKYEGHNNNNNENGSSYVPSSNVGGGIGDGSTRDFRDDDDGYHARNQAAIQSHRPTDDSLSRAFDRGVRIEEPPTQTDCDWFEDGGDDQREQRGAQDTNRHQTPQERRRQLLIEKRRQTKDEGVDTSDYGSDSFEGTTTTTTTSSKEYATRPQTEPVTLQMIKVFGRGSNVSLEDGDRVGFGSRAEPEPERENRTGFGSRFPQSLGRGTMTSVTMGEARTTTTAAAAATEDAVGRNTPTPYQAAMKQNILDSLRGDGDERGNFDEDQFRGPSSRDGSPFHQYYSDENRRSPYPQQQRQEQQQQQQQQRQRLNQQERQYKEQQYRQFQQQRYEQHQQTFRDDEDDDDDYDDSFAPPSSRNPEVDAATMLENRQVGYADFPSFQRGVVPPYSSTFCADRPLSKQAQIQLAQQQQQMDGDDYGRHVKRGKRGRNVGRGTRFQFSQQQQPQQQQRDESEDPWNERKVAFGRGVSFGRGSAYYD